MKLLVLINLFCILAAPSRAATALGNFADPKHPGKCVVGNLILSPGQEVLHLPSCSIKSCGEGGWVSFHTCGVVAILPGFELPKRNKPATTYPECCIK